MPNWKTFVKAIEHDRALRAREKLTFEVGYFTKFKLNSEQIVSISRDL